jgi:hypothetical protein
MDLRTSPESFPPEVTRRPLPDTSDSPGDQPPPAPARSGPVRRAVDLALTAAPTAAFLTTNAISAALPPALLAAGGVAVAVFGWRIYRRERLRKAFPGVLIVAICAAVAAATGQARGFFLVPTLIPFAVIALCVTTIAIGRPLTGLLLNRIAGGPGNWYGISRLRRVYFISTSTAVAINVVNAAVQVAFYRADEPVVLGAAHVATGPVFAGLVAGTIVFARRAITTHRTGAVPGQR